MKNILLFFLFNTLFLFTLSAQIPDASISPVKASSMLGKGILFEPQAGNVSIGFSAPYKPEYGDIIKEAGFKSVRVRYQSDKNPMMIAIENGPPYDASVDKLLDETDFIIDDLLNKNLAVVLTFYGLTEDNPGDLDKMVSWWGYVANRFKNKSHKLIFNLFVEPLKLIANKDPHRIFDYYEAITKEIRKINPDRLIIYYAIPPENKNNNPFGPGADYFMTKAYNPVPSEAGIYYLWDFHVLKPDAKDNIRKVEQAWEYMDSTKQVVWSGAWNAKNTENEMWYAKPTAIDVNRRFVDRGISYAYLMMFDGGTSLFDAQQDHNENGKINEWAYPGLRDILTSGPDIWWNMLDNPGFEQDTLHWKIEGSNFSIMESDENHFLQLPSAHDIRVSQEITLALKNNGPGEYHIVGYVTSTGNTQIKFTISGIAGGQPFRYESHATTIVTGQARLINDSIAANWSGSLENARLTVEISGDTCTLDKMGLTQFYYAHPRLNITLWPGERIHHNTYSSRSNSVMDINSQLRNMIYQGINNNESSVISLANDINSVAYDLETRLIALIGNDYQRTSNGTQYRINGYYQGTANAQYRNSVASYIGGKDKTASQLNDSLIMAQNRARDYFIKNSLSFRELFYDVFKSYPPGIESQTGIDTTVFVSGKILTASETGAAYRWLDCENLYNPIGGATKQSFSPAMSGKYAVEISKNNYVLKSGCHKMVIQTGILSSFRRNTTKVFPTRTKNYITIQPENEHLPFTAILIDLQGRKIKTFSPLYPPSSRIALDVKKGLYLLKLVFQNKNETFKIFKQ